MIINDILDFSKIEAGKLSVEYIRFNFRELLDDLEHVFAPQAQAKNISAGIFHRTSTSRSPSAATRTVCARFIVNLLGNAIKFTETRQGHRESDRAAAKTRPSVGLRFEVHDTGIGVSNGSAQTRIFESFSQADGSTTRKHGGTGLGLTISRNSWWS